MGRKGGGLSAVKRMGGGSEGGAEGGTGIAR